MIKKICLLLISAISLFSCQKTEIPRSFSFLFFSRTCDYIYVDNIKVEVRREPDGIYFSIVPLYSENVLVEEFGLMLSTCNMGIDEIYAIYPDYEAEFNGKNYNPKFYCPYMFLSEKYRFTDPTTDERDLAIESLIEQALKKSSQAAPYLLNGAKIDYRTSELTGLKIICSEPLFGIPAGGSLNDYFILECYPTNQDFIISAQYRIINDPIIDIDIDRYLSYRPFAPAAVYLKLKPMATVAAPVDVTFTVEMEIDNTKTISNTSKSVRLLPKQ